MEGGKWKEEKDDKADKKTRYYEKYLRLWHMLEAFSEKEFIPRRDMIRHVFQGILFPQFLKNKRYVNLFPLLEHVHELEQYESANLVAYVYKKMAPSYESLLGRGLRQKEVCMADIRNSRTTID